MQSTGHTSTQDRSFTWIHGSAMMYGILSPVRIANLDSGLAQSRDQAVSPIPTSISSSSAGGSRVLPRRSQQVSWIPVGIIHRRRKAETRSLLVSAGLELFAERGFEIATLDEVALAAGFTKGAIYRHFPSKGAFLLALFEQYAAVARAGSGARQARWFIPLTVQFAAQATRDPLLRRRLVTVLSEAPEGSTPEGQLLKALARIWPS